MKKIDLVVFKKNKIINKTLYSFSEIEIANCFKAYPKEDNNKLRLTPTICDEVVAKLKELPSTTEVKDTLSALKIISKVSKRLRVYYY